MDIRQFRYFIAVAEELNFTRAAARLRIGQPPLSIQIKAMEDELGVTLFRRNRHRVELTPAGETLLMGARRVLSEVEGSILAAQRVARGETGTLRIGFSGDVPLLPAFRIAIREHRRTMPGVRLDLVSATASAQVDGILAGNLDLGFLRFNHFRRLPEEIATLTMFQDRLAVIVSADHPLAAKKAPLPIESVRDEPFVFYQPGVGTYTHVMTLCARSGFMPRVVQDARDSTSIISLVATGLGVSVLPTILQHKSAFDVHFRPLRGKDAGSSVLLAWRRSAPIPQVRSFVEFVKQQLDKTT